MLNGKILYIPDPSLRRKNGLLKRIEITLRLYKMVFQLVCFTASVLIWGVMIGEGTGAAKAFGKVSMQIDSLTLEVRRYNVIRFADDLVYRSAFRQLQEADSVLSARVARLEKAQKKAATK